VPELCPETPEPLADALAEVCDGCVCALPLLSSKPLLPAFTLLSAAGAVEELVVESL
jgi:hypothetical protein